MLMVLTMAQFAGVMWMSLEGATLTTVLMVGLYRTAEALEAAQGISFYAVSGTSRSRSLFHPQCILPHQPVMERRAAGIDDLGCHAAAGP